ncbi:MAG: ABC transporter permease, partial [Saprospiraceae bacterium]|nr:ABC transporter permease [Saprospiraceae bacterium]
MLQNYLFIGLRNLLKDRGYTLLNVLGLTVGITFSLLLLLYVADELNYDRFHEKTDRIVRVGSHVKETENEFHWASTQFQTAETLKHDYPAEVEDAVRVLPSDRTEYRNGEQRFTEKKFCLAGENIFRIFTLPLLEGDPNTALTEPNSMVLSRSTADKYFGKNTACLGKTLTNNRNETWKITGVMQDVPAHSHIRFDALLSDHEIRKITAANGGDWGQFSSYTYALLRPGVGPATFEKKIGEMYDKYMASIFKPLNININYMVQPIAEIHLHSIMDEEPEPLGSLAYVRILGLTALFLVLLACINYINLTTARATRRAREVGVRKALGSSRGMLAAQFLTESALLALASGALGLTLAWLLLPVFNTMSGKEMAPDALLQPVILGGLATMLVLAGLIGGSYPALVLSGFKTVSVLKGDSVKAGGGLLRRGLVVIQFAVSLIMLIATGVIFDQLNFLKNKDTGFQKDQVLVLRADPGSVKRGEIAAFRHTLQQNPSILAVGGTWVSPGKDVAGKNVTYIEGNEGMKEIGIDITAVDEFLLPALDIKIVQGHNFDGTPGDTLNSVLVNEALVKKMGWADPIGKKLRFSTDNPFAQVIGVVKDYHQKSLYNPIEPLILLYRRECHVIHARVRPDDLPGTLKSVESAWKANFPAQEFKYTFLDENFNEQFSADQKRGVLFSVFSGLSIFIACLGLLGLVAYTTEQRRREIGIRKVLGAEPGQMVALLARHFVVLVLIAGVLAIPTAWWFLQRWLEEFPYKTDLQPLTFIGALLA